MTILTRKLALSAVTACLALVLGAAPAVAKTTHHHKAHHHAKAAHGADIIRTAQQHLANLGYYTGGIDGKLGKQTKAAIKKFQRDQHLKADGVLGSKTNRALALADAPIVTRPQAFSTHEAVTSAELATLSINPDYASSLKGSVKPLSSRFAQLGVSETLAGSVKLYNVTLNGNPILTADGQPSIIDISQTYDLGNEDAVVFTTYNAGDSICLYKTHVLALTNTGTQLLDIKNCTRAYTARTADDSLYLTFPESDDNRAIGATWRVEGMSAERL